MERQYIFSVRKTADSPNRILALDKVIDICRKGKVEGLHKSVFFFFFYNYLDDN